MTNEQRAHNALVAVQAYRKACRGSPLNSSEGLQEAIGDLICDLCHLVVPHESQPFITLQNAAANYAAETVADDGMFLEVNAVLDVMARPYGRGGNFQPYNKESLAGWRAEVEKEMSDD